MKQKKFNRASDIMKQLYEEKDIKGLIDFKNNYPDYSSEAECYILRIEAEFYISIIPKGSKVDESIKLLCEL